MTHVSYAELQQNSLHYPDKTNETRVPVVINRHGGKGNMVLLSEDELAGWQETVHLLSSPRNADRLLRGTRQAGQETLPERGLLAPNSTSDA